MLILSRPQCIKIPRLRISLKYGGHFRWETPDAQVVCRQLGYTGGEAMSNAAFGEGSGNIWLDNVECDGDETQLSECDHRGWGQGDCEHHEDAGVICDTGKHAA